MQERSYDILRLAAERVGVKALAHHLNLSPAMVYKWCEPPQEEDSDQSGARNPLDRVREIVMLTRDTMVVHWLCFHAGGYYVPNPATPDGDPDADMLVRTQELVAYFSRLLAEVSASASDSCVDANEAGRIRHSWERLKSAAESFVLACEKGNFLPPKQP